MSRQRRRVEERVRPDVWPEPIDRDGAVIDCLDPLHRFVGDIPQNIELPILHDRRGKTEIVGCEGDTVMPTSVLPNLPGGSHASVGLYGPESVLEARDFSSEKRSDRPLVI